MTTQVEPIAFARRGGLLVPVDQAPALVETETVPQVEPEFPQAEVTPKAPEAREVGDERGGQPWEELADRLAGERRTTSVRNGDKVERRRQDVNYGLDRAELRHEKTLGKLKLRERTRAEKSAAKLDGLYRQAMHEGTHARIRADIQRSAEMRALRVDTARKSAFWVGIPALIGFAAYSTPGVQAGAAQLLGAEHGGAVWWSAWLVEPLLIGFAAWLITVRSLLAMSGGQLASGANKAKWGALVISVALNMTGGWNGGHGTLAAIGEALAHSVGALGAAVTAWVIGLIVNSAAAAKPWHGEGVQRLQEMGLTRPPSDANPREVSDEPHADEPADDEWDDAVGRTEALFATHSTPLPHTDEPARRPVAATGDARKIESASGRARTGETRKIESASGWSAGVPVASLTVAADARDGDGSDSEALRADACAAWLEAARAGTAVSGTALGRQFGMSPRWGQERVREARAELARAQLPGQMALTDVPAVNGHRTNGTAVTR